MFGFGPSWHPADMLGPRFAPAGYHDGIYDAYAGPTAGYGGAFSSPFSRLRGVYPAGASSARVEPSGVRRGASRGRVRPGFIPAEHFFAGEVDDSNAYDMYGGDEEEEEQPRRSASPQFFIDPITGR